MTLIGTTSELEDLGGGQQQLTQHLRPIAYRDAQGSLQYINNDFTDSGDGLRPHIVTAAPMIVSVGSDGARRIHPTRDLERYFEIGAPWVKIGGVWTQVALGSPSRTRSRLQWTTAQANVYLDMAGHYCKIGILLKNGWRPEGGQFAFPIGIQGLTRQGGQLYADGVPVMSLRAPVVYDFDNEDDVRAIDWRFVRLSGQDYILFTLPDLTGMSKPLVDPTLALQPDASAGKDTFIRQNAANNFGQLQQFSIGESNAASNAIDRTLIQFDLSLLPASATISSATLSPYAVTDRADNASTIGVYRLKRAWVEGTGSAGSGANWNTYDGVTSWETAGGFGANDCEQTPIGTLALTASETINAFKDIPLTPTTKTALDLGNGWMVRVVGTELNDNYIYNSSDYTTAANRPKLTIVYTEGGLLLFRQRYGG